jgi:hypothetical protein
MIRTSDDITLLAVALVAAQAVMPDVPKGSLGQIGQAKVPYSNLGDVLETVRPVLHEHGLAFIQFPGNGDNGMTQVTTRLVHVSGQWMEGTVSMPSGGNGAQGVGSAITYARRYSLMSVLGLASEDDDGKAASQQQRQQPAARQPKPPARPADPDAPPRGTVTDAQIRAMGAAFTGAGIKDRDKRIDYIRQVVLRSVMSSTELSSQEAGKVLDKLAAETTPHDMPADEYGRDS